MRKISRTSAPVASLFPCDRDILAADIRSLNLHTHLVGLCFRCPRADNSHVENLLPHRTLGNRGAAFVPFQPCHYLHPIQVDPVNDMDKTLANAPRSFPCTDAFNCRLWGEKYIKDNVEFTKVSIHEYCTNILPASLPTTTNARPGEG